MPEFSPGVSKTAVVTMSNPTVGAFDYLAELYMGINLALMASNNFHLEAGEAKDINLLVTMPSEAGTYPVHIGVFSNGVSIGLYKATEDVVITAPAPFVFSNLSVSRTRCQSATAWNTLNFGCTITNPTDRSITHILTPMYRVETKYGYGDPRARSLYAREVTLGPGESYNYYLPGNQPDRCTILLGFSAGVPYGGCAFLRDENGNDSPQVCL